MRCVDDGSSLQARHNTRVLKLLAEMFEVLCTTVHKAFVTSGCRTQHADALYVLSLQSKQ